MELSRESDQMADPKRIQSWVSAVKRIVAVGIVLGAFTVAHAQVPAVKLITAPLVTTSDATMYYGTDTAHTQGPGRWTWTPTPPEIAALASSLGSGRVLANLMSSADYAQNVYDYVRNNIEVEFRFGLSKGARGALIDQSGTPFDQADLMVALLRVAGLTPSYILGNATVTAAQFGAWTGVIKTLDASTQAVTVDAKAACQFLADGGIPADFGAATSCANVSGDLTSVTMRHIWVKVDVTDNQGHSLPGMQYDPSFKTHVLAAGIDIGAAMGCGTTCGTTLVSAAGGTFGTINGRQSLSAINQTAIDGFLHDRAVSLQNQIATTNRIATAQDIVGGRRLVNMTQTASTTLPYTATPMGTGWPDIPDRYRTTLRVRFLSGGPLEQQVGAQGRDLTFFADEIAGRRVQLDAQDLFYVDGLMLTHDVDGHNVPEGVPCPAPTCDFSVVSFDVNHPYAASGGTYADEHLDQQIQVDLAPGQVQRGEFPVTLIIGWGNGSPSTERYASDLAETDQSMWQDAVDDTTTENRTRHDSTFESSNHPLLGAKLRNQGSAADRLLEGMTQTSILRHHDIGVVFGYPEYPSLDQISVQSAVSLTLKATTTNSTADIARRSAAFETSAGIWALIEASTTQQVSGGNLGLWTGETFRLTNSTGHSFVYNTPADLQASTDLLSRALGNAGYTVISSTSNEGAISVRPDAVSNTVYGVLKGSGGDPDPADKAMESARVYDAAAARKKYLSVSPADGEATITQTDLVAGTGDFPQALPFIRTYRSNSYVNQYLVNESSQTFDYNTEQSTGSTTYSLRYSGPDSSAGAHLGGGWNHSYNIFVNLAGGGDRAFGSQSAIEGSYAIATLWTIYDAALNPTFASRVISALAENDLGVALMFASAVVDKGGQSETFQRLPDRSWFSLRGDSSLVQTGDPSWPNVLDFSAVTFHYTGPKGDTIDFDPAYWSKKRVDSSTTFTQKAEPVFKATNWSFPDGTVVTFTYTGQWLVNSWAQPITVTCSLEHCDSLPPAVTLPYGYVLQSVSNNFGRTLTFSTASDSVPIPQNVGGFPGYMNFSTGFRITDVTDENGRNVHYALSDCSPPQFSDQNGSAVVLANATFGCNTFTASSADFGTKRYTYDAGSDSPNPPFWFKSPYRLRRLYTPDDLVNPFRTFVYDELFRVRAVKSSIAPDGHPYYVYPGSVLASEHWKPGEQVSYLGSVTRSIFDEHGSVLSTTDPVGATTTNQYDNAARLVRSQSPEGNSEVRTYDLRSNVLSSCQLPKSRAGQTCSVAAGDLLTTTTYGEGPSVVPCSNAKTCNQPVTVTDPRNYVTRNTWDPGTGLLSRVETGLNTGLTCALASGVCPRTDLIYTPAQSNGVSMLRQMTRRVSSTSNLISTFAYNESNHWVPFTSTTNSGSSNLTTTLTFDAYGNVTQLDGPRTDVNDVRNFTWDLERRLTAVIEADPDGGGPLPRPAVKTTYYPDGLVQTSARGTTTTPTASDFVPAETTSYFYDKSGNRVQQNTPSGITQYSYDGDDRLLCTAIRMNPDVYGSLPSDACTHSTAGVYGADRIVRNIYDDAGRITKEQRAFATPLQFDYFTRAYTSNGKVDWVEDANGNRSEYVYDGFDRLCRLFFPQPTIGSHLANTGDATLPLDCSGSPTGDYEQYAYDANGNRTTLIKRGTGAAAARTITYSYDALNRETLKDIPGGTATDVYSDYDLLNRKLYSHFGSAGTISADCSATPNGIDYCYDVLGRLTTEKSNARALSYQWDDAGNRTRITWTDGNYVQYTYDAMNRMLKVCENGDLTCTAGVLATYGYDNLGRRGSVVRGDGTRTDFAYDNASRLSSLSEDLSGTANDLVIGIPTYNPASQIVDRSISNPVFAYSVPGESRAFTPDGLNRYSSVDGITFGYDERGNLTSDGVRTFGYDIENRLTSVSGSASMGLSYDPAGRLQQTVAGGATTQFLYDGDRLTEEFDGSGTTALRRYVHGANVDEPLVWYEGSGLANKRWLHSDHQGSVVAYSDASGATTTYAYGPYGEPSGDNWTGSRFRYTGQIALNDAPGLRLYHYKARVYDPYLGRFFQSDPIGYQDDFDVYAYTYNDPLNNADPAGTDGVGCWNNGNECDQIVANGAGTYSKGMEVILGAKSVLSARNGNLADARFERAGAKAMGKFADGVTNVRAAAQVASGDLRGAAKTVTGDMIDKAIGQATAGLMLIVAPEAFESAPAVANGVEFVSGTLEIGDKMSGPTIDKVADAAIGAANAINDSVNQQTEKVSRQVDTAIQRSVCKSLPVLGDTSGC